MHDVAEYCIRRIDPDHLLGFLFETWEFTVNHDYAMSKHNEYFKLVEPIIRKFG